MKILLFGATGMVGQGVLRECLLDPGVSEVLSVVRAATKQVDPKLTEIVLDDFTRPQEIEGRLAGFDACFFSLGVSSAGLSEPAYTRITYSLTLGLAGLLVRRNPAMTFIYVSGAGTGERSRFMWARVKGRTENALRRLPFKAAYMFRPGAIQPLHGARSKTAWVQTLYSVTAPIYPVLRRLLPNAVTTTEQIGRAMIAVARTGSPKPVLETADINAIT